MLFRRMGALALVLTASLFAGCVTKSEHERLMDEANGRLLASQQQHQQQMAAAQGEIVRLQAEIVRLQGEIAARDTAMAEAQRQIADLQAKLDNAMALSEQLRSTLENAGKNVDKLLAEKGNLATALADTKVRLEELRKAQEAAQRRADLFKNLLLKFKRMIDAGDLAIVLRDGRMVLQLRNDVLFDSGKVSIKREGQEALREVAGILVTLDARSFQVAGHTDNVPISTDRFPSNWELSAARAINVVKFLTEAGVKPELLSAAGYGEHDPVAANDDDAGKAKNRRIEIVLQPDISELVQLPEVAR
jgi:chemotaxis protein MotB